MSIKAGLHKQNEKISHRVGGNINSYKSKDILPRIQGIPASQ